MINKWHAKLCKRQGCNDNDDRVVTAWVSRFRLCRVVGWLCLLWISVVLESGDWESVEVAFELFRSSMNALISPILFEISSWTSSASNTACSSWWGSSIRSAIRSSICLSVSSFLVSWSIAMGKCAAESSSSDSWLKILSTLLKTRVTSDL